MSFSDYLRSDSSSSQNTPSISGSGNGNRDSIPLNKSGPPSVSHPQETSSDGHSLPFSFEHDRQHSSMGIGPSTFSNQINFQMPPYILGGPPSIPPDGGAEVMHGMLPSPSSNVLPSNGWFMNDFLRYGDSVPMLSQASYQNSGSLDPNSVNPSQSNMYRQQSPIYNNDQSAMNVDANSSNLSSYSANDNPPVASPKPPAAFQLDTFNPTNPIDPTKVGIPTNVQPLLYSASGFDVLGILAKVATRPKPKIVLGPVDFTCSFCFVDVRRYDHPIVYASPTFYKLTGYSEHEILGKNCRFLQSPEGGVERGMERKFTSPEAVQHLKKSLVANKECQASLINYRKGGQAFINLITVIPVTGDDSDEIAYQVGFQVDLTEQPSAILQRLNDGSYIVNYSASVSAGSSGYRDRSLVISKELRYILSNGQPSPIPKPEQDRVSLNTFLLENSEDFIHVLSLKGLFQYVSPSVRKVLEYDADELIGKSISDICHPADITPVIRELKESSTHIAPPPEAGTSVQPTLKTVNLLFRARTKSSGYVWIESHGQLHVEPGKGRKSIILVGRLRLMPKLHWEAVDRAGGFTDNEFWGLVSPHGLWLKVNKTMSQILDRPMASLVGSSLLEMIPRTNHKTNVVHALYEAAFPTGSLSDKDSVHLQVELCPSQSTRFTADIVFYTRESAGPTSPTLAAVPVVCQIKVVDPTSPEPANYSRGHLLPNSSSNPPLMGNQLPAINVFEELDTTRHTSWQYELTHMKIANKNLLADIAKMEIKHGLRPPHPTIADAPPQNTADEQQHPDSSSIDSRPTKKRPRTSVNNNQDGQS